MTIPAADQLAAAEAVIAALYGVDTAFSNLQHEQLVHALILADMLNASEVVDKVVFCLEAAAVLNNGLSETALAALADLVAWPECLLKLLPSIAAHASCCKPTHNLATTIAADTSKYMQRILLNVFGNIPAVLRDAELKRLLLKLPLAAMQLLLDSDELQVPSEDDVLYVAQYYCREYYWAHVRSAANGSSDDIDEADEERQVSAAFDGTAPYLSPVVRAPHLSDLALHIAVLARHSKSHLLEGYTAYSLSKLITLRRFASRAQVADVMKEGMYWPASWKRGQRQLLTEPPVITYHCSVQELAATWIDNSHNHLPTGIIHTDVGHDSIILGGLKWSLELSCHTKASGTRMGIFIRPEHDAPVGIYVKMKAHVVCKATNTDRWGEWNYVLGCDSYHDDADDGGWSDFWEAGFMPNGWDEAAWAAKGLPLSGDLVVELSRLSIS